MDPLSALLASLQGGASGPAVQAGMAAGAGGAIMRVCKGLTWADARSGSWKSSTPDMPSKSDTCTSSTTPASHASVRREGRPVLLPWMAGKVFTGLMCVSGRASPDRSTAGWRTHAGPGRQGLSTRH